jgi:hypothetical protein
MAGTGAPRTGTGYLRFLSLGGWVYAAVTIFSTLARIITTFTRDIVDIRMPVATFWPQLHPSVELDPAPAAAVVSGGFTWAEVAVEGLGTEVRLLHAAGLLAAGATGAIVAIAIAVLCHRVLADDPFRPAVSRAATISGGSVLIGGLVWQVFSHIAGTITSRSVLFIEGWSSDSEEFSNAFREDIVSDVGWPQPAIEWTVDLWPIWIGLALLAVGTAFRRGERLREKAEQLQRDTAGLV